MEISMTITIDFIISSKDNSAEHVIHSNNYSRNYITSFLT